MQKIALKFKFIPNVCFAALLPAQWNDVNDPVEVVFKTISFARKNLHFGHFILKQEHNMCMTEVAELL